MEKAKDIIKPSEEMIKSFKTKDITKSSKDVKKSQRKEKLEEIKEPDHYDYGIEEIYEINVDQDPDELEVEVTEVDFDDDTLSLLMAGKIEPSLFPHLSEKEIQKLEEELRDRFNKIHLLGEDGLSKEDRDIIPVKSGMGNPLNLFKHYDKGKDVEDVDGGKLVTCISMYCEEPVLVKVPPNKVTSPNLFLCEKHRKK